MRDSNQRETGHGPILTQRLVLRPRRAADETTLRALAASPAIAPNLCATIPDDCAALMAIAELDTGRLIGGSAHGATALGSGVEVSLWIGEPDWGRGYGTEAAQALIDHAFRSQAVDALWCSHRPANARARCVIEKCGFQFRGSGMVRLPGRGAAPVERFSLDRRTWTSLKAWGGTARTEGDGDAARETAA